MYENSELLKSTSIGGLGAGAVVLPNTQGNTIGAILAYTAISIGIIALLSQLVLRLVRRHQAKQQN